MPKITSFLLKNCKIGQR